MRDRWTAERVRLLQQLWAGGATGESIAAQLGGFSRSAVLGKILRLRRAATSSGAPNTLPARPRRKPSEPPPPAPRSEPKALLDLTNNCCRWPTAGSCEGEIVYCGAPEADVAAGMPYCPYHAWRAYVIPPRRVAASKPKAASAAKKPDAVRDVWRAPVRHPAPRRR